MVHVEYESSSGVGGGGGGGAYARDKNTLERLCAKKVGGASARGGGAYLQHTMVYALLHFCMPSLGESHTLMCGSVANDHLFSHMHVHTIGYCDGHLLAA